MFVSFSFLKIDFRKNLEYYLINPKVIKKTKNISRKKHQIKQIHKISLDLLITREIVIPIFQRS